MDNSKMQITLSEDKAVLMPTTEIVGVMLTASMDAASIKDFSSSARENLMQQFNVAVGDDFSLGFPKNSDKQVHLALPYYESFDSVDVEMLEDEFIDKVSGGEIIFFLIPALIGVKIAAVVGATAAVTTTAVVAGGVTIASATTVAATTGALVAGGVIGATVGGGVAAAVGGTAAAVAVGVTKEGKGK